MESGEREGINIVVKLLGGAESALFVPPAMLVGELKDLLAHAFNKPRASLLVVHNGVRLYDGQRLNETRVAEGSRLHLAVRLSAPRQPAEPPGAPPAGDFPLAALAGLVGALSDSALGRGFGRRLARAQQRLHGFPINGPESLEVLRQSVSTMRMLLSEECCWEEGQWVDARDTVDQWLEAEIIGTCAESVLVHYNGFGSQWDEWVGRASERLAPFRTHTVPSPYQTLASPAPDAPLDASPRPRPPPFAALQALRAVEGLLGEALDALRLLAGLKAERRRDEVVDVRHALLTRLTAKNKDDRPRSEASKAGDSDAERAELELPEKRDKKGDNLSLKLEEEHAPDCKSISSLCLDKGARLKEKLSRSISPKGSVSHRSFANVSQDEREAAELPALALRARARALAPLLDRLGRAMIDLAPHIAMLSAPLVKMQSNLLGNVSTASLDGSFNASFDNLRLFDRFSDAQNYSHPRAGGGPAQAVPLSSDQPLFFQVPVLLTPAEVFYAQLRGQEAGGTHVDLHLSAVVRDSGSAAAAAEPPARTPPLDCTDFAYALR